MERGAEALRADRIENYALLGDCETAALVSREGSIDWLCWPDFSSGACFAGLLGTSEHGYWKLAPADPVVSVRPRYLPQTMVVETTMETAKGAIRLLDFMPLRQDHSRVIRMVEGVRGRVAMRMELSIRFDYGQVIPWVTSHDGVLRAIAGPDCVLLHTKAKLHGEGLITVSEFTLESGDTESFSLTYTSSLLNTPAAPDVAAALAETMEFWIGWAATSAYRGQYQEAVDRSLMTLKALTYRPSGGIVAAPTTSLPERIGGERNWDYRFCWLRDTAFTLLVLMGAGYKEEAIAWRLWLLRAIAGAPENVQAIYGIRGERSLIEHTADWLPGYEDSRPVNIGNGAAGQFQLDLYGEVATALLRTPEAEQDIRLDASAMLARLIDHLCKVWQEPDEGIWETRGGAQQFVHSKVMAWVALDRAIKHVGLCDGAGDVKRWRKNRDMIRAEILEKGFNREMNSFTQTYGSREVDASLLRLVLVGFLPPDDPRIIGTVEAIERELLQDGLVKRYNTEGGADGLKGGEGVFLACSFWLASNLHLIGRTDDARALFERLLALSNDLGLLSEEYDSESKRMLGNFPQALSHIALVHAAFTLSGRWRPEVQ